LQAQFPQYAGKNVKYQPYVNSVKNFFRTGVSSVTSVNLSGSNANTSYNFTAGKTSEDGFVPSNNLGKINIGAGINSNLTKKLNITVSTNYTETNLTTPPISGGGGSGPLNGVSIYSDVLYTPVNVDLMGLPFEAPIDHRSVYYRTGNDIQNPRWTAKYTKQTDDVRRFFGSTSINFKITNDLKATYRVGLDNYNETQEYVVNKGGPNFLNGFYRTQNIQNTIWNQDFLLTYTKQFNDISFSATAGVQSRQDDRTSYGMYSSNQVIFGVINHNNFLSHSNVDGLTGANLNYNSTLKYQGVYATAMIGYKDYLYLNVQGRNDWSSAVEKANSSIFYPSASISFVPTTAFGIESDALRMLRLRAGYGQSAGFPAPYNTRNYIYNNPRGFLDKAGQPVNIHSVSDQLGNPNLTPELFSEVELGVEAQMLKGRLNAEITWYNKVSKKLIMQAPIDPATGFTNTFVNLGQMTNQGIEVNINGTPIVVGDFKWDLALNFFHYTSIVNSLGSGLTQVLIPGGGYSGGPGNWAIPGQSFDVIQGTYVQRDAQGRMLVAPDGNYVPSHDQKIIGNPIPDYTSSVITSFHYKGITLSAQIDYRKGGAIYSTTAATLLARGVTQDTNFNREATFILPGVQADGSKNTVQLTSSDTFFNNYGFGPQELQVYDGTTIRLAQVSLGYSLPKSVIGKTPFKAVNISVQGQNLWYNAVNFPKYMHFDTNQLSTGVGNALGLDFLTGPSARKYGVTLGLKF
jgi:outer membrane receptor protein involved in Fe transport